MKTGTVGIDMLNDGEVLYDLIWRIGVFFGVGPAESDS
jgi:hypothetical protein